MTTSCNQSSPAPLHRGSETRTTVKTLASFHAPTLIRPLLSAIETFFRRKARTCHLVHGVRGLSKTTREGIRDVQVATSHPCRRFGTAGSGSRPRVRKGIAQAYVGQDHACKEVFYALVRLKEPFIVGYVTPTTLDC